MKKSSLVWIIAFLSTYLFSPIAFSQDTTQTFKSKIPGNSCLDSIWSFCPGALNASAGTWMPLGKLSAYYSPCFQFGVGIGFKISHKIRCDLGLTPRFLIDKKKTEVIIDNTVTEVKTPSGISAGGCVNYRVFRNKLLFTELVAGFHSESIDINHPNPKSHADSTLDISTWGISLGMNTWINKFGKQNIGLRVLYNYAPFNNDKQLISDIGGHFVSVSLCYKFPGRDISYKRDYDEYYRNHFGQEPLVLQHRKKVNRYKKLYLDREYTFKTTDTTYDSEILSFSDTTVTITRWIPGTETEIVHYEDHRGKRGKDEMRTIRKYIDDTLALPNSQILYIKKDWFKNREWLAPFGYLAFAGVLGVIGLPVAAIVNGKKGVNDLLRFDVIVIAISAPPIFLGTRSTKYNLKKKWKIKTDK